MAETEPRMWLLPPAADKCQDCARAHEPELPHSAESLFYQTKFNLEHGRAATWLDAMAHCTPELQARWRAELIRLGVDVDAGAVNPSKPEAARG